MNVFVLNVKKSEFFFKTFWDIQNNSCIFALAFENLDVEYIKKKYNEDSLFYYADKIIFRLIDVDGNKIQDIIRRCTVCLKAAEP